MMNRVLSIAAFAALCLAPASATFRVLQPASGAKEYANTEAQFGIPHYGGSITGQLFYGTPGDRDGCTALHSPGSGTAPWQDAIAAGRSVVVMVDRGNNCTFVQKIRNGQDAAATAVVVADNVEESFLPVMADDGTGSTVHIPSIFVGKTSGDEMKALIAAGETVMVQLSWETPSTDTNVEWEYWMTSNDDSSVFKHEFRPVAAALGERAHLNAHWLYIPGEVFGCTLGEAGNRPCGKQCTNQGRYCAQDPEHDVSTGEDGEDVVAENMRQMCIFKAMDGAKTMDKWWNYIDLFYDHCEPNDATFNKACSETQMDALGISKTAVQQCVDLCGGIGAEDGVNTCIEEEIAAAASGGIHVLPSVLANNRIYTGRLTCPAPIDLGSCGLLSEICQGYAAGYAPNACKSNHCWEVIDECGVCGGDGVKDSCGTCRVAADRNTAKWNSECTGCDGVLNSGKMNDPCGVCGGSGTFDACGACLQAGDSRRQTDAGSCSDGGSVSFTAIAVGLLMLVVGGGGGYVYMNKREKRMKEEMESVLARYMPLDNSADFGSTTGEKVGLLNSI